MLGVLKQTWNGPGTDTVSPIAKANCLSCFDRCSLALPQDWQMLNECKGKEGTSGCSIALHRKRLQLAPQQLGRQRHRQPHRLLCCRLLCLTIQQQACRKCALPWERLLPRYCITCT